MIGQLENGYHVPRRGASHVFEQDLEAFEYDIEQSMVRTINRFHVGSSL